MTTFKADIGERKYFESSTFFFIHSSFSIEVIPSFLKVPKKEKSLLWTWKLFLSLSNFGFESKKVTDEETFKLVKECEMFQALLTDFSPLRTCVVQRKFAI